MILKGFFDRFKDITNGESGNVTVSQVGDKVGLDVNVVSGGGGGGGDATAANQTTQITEAQSTNTKLDTIESSLNSIQIGTDNLTLATSNIVGQSDTLATIRDSQTVNKDWDYYDLTYVASGNGVGQVETITYYTGTPGSGTAVLTLTYTYDASDRVSRVERA